ncbi:MAG TPA: nucleoside-diphosphate sugar epimerase/dehydratase [Ruminococcus sp.]|nr:nucleoside-diphosphate sugar epimerase/dehydratase [Ruminococcus sp.]
MKEYLGKFSVRKMILMVADCFIIAVSALFADYILSLYGVNVSRAYLSIFMILSVVLSVGCLKSCGAYNKMWRYFSRKDYVCCAVGITIGTVLSTLAVIMLDVGQYLLLNLVQLYLALFGICMFRYLFKDAFITLTRTGREEAKVKRAMIIGAGQACKLILEEVEGTKRLPQYNLHFEPVCIIDDDPEKTGQFMHGVPIEGTSADIDRCVKEKNIELILFAIPSASEESRQRILEKCSKTELLIKVIPFIGDLLFENGEKKIISQIRDIRIEDLLGRDPIKIQDENIRNFIQGKVCMVTGGGGSIGSEIVRQISRNSPKQVIIVDIYENNAYEIQQELLMEHSRDLDLVVLIASVRDYYRMDSIFKEYRPDVVFHAAAHKHVPLMEVSPMEAIKNNIIGTFNMATLADAYHVEKFVMISTDKAVNPTNVMGASKRCCEMIVQYMSQQPGVSTEYVTTRFGNVLGSNGSVIPIFKKQIEQGKPITITHPDITRYFMSIPEATSLVLEAATMAHGGEIFVLDMGKPVKIVSLAENLIRMYGKKPYEDVEIRFIGLRPGEKITEELLMDEEGLAKTDNKLIFIGSQIKIDEKIFIEKLSTLKQAALTNNCEMAVSALHDMVPTFTTPEEYNSTHMKEGK